MAEETHIQKRVIRVDPRSLKLLELNAHFMRSEVFAQMVENIRKDGDLMGNTPFGVLVRDADGQPTDPPIYQVISGNHRVKAAILAGLAEMVIEVTDDALSKDRRRAIQLSHNRIVGEDDPAILKMLYEEIDDVEMRLYTGVDDKALGLLVDVNVASLSEAALQFQTIALTFLPHEVEGVAAALESARKAASGAKGFWLTRWADYDRAMDALEAAGSAYGVKNAATAMMVVLEVFSRHMDDLQAGYLDADGEAIDPKRAVPVESVLGRTLPARLAAKLRRLGVGSGAELEALLETVTTDGKGGKDDSKQPATGEQAGADRTPAEGGGGQPTGRADTKGHRRRAERESGDGIG